VFSIYQHASDSIYLVKWDIRVDCFLLSKRVLMERNLIDV
jgi:hypothetical protein